MPSSTAADWWDRGVTLAGTAVAIVLGAACMSDVERLWAQQAAVFDAPSSNTTINRTLAAVDEDLPAGVARARSRLDAAAAAADRVPVAGRGRETAHRVDRGRHRRDLDHRAFGQGRGGGHVQEDLRPSSAYGLVRQYGRVAGDAAAARERRVEHSPEPPMTCWNTWKS